MKIHGSLIRGSLQADKISQARWTAALCALLVLGVCGLQHRWIGDGTALQVTCRLST